MHADDHQHRGSQRFVDVLERFAGASGDNLPTGDGDRQAEPEQQPDRDRAGGVVAGMMLGLAFGHRCQIAQGRGGILGREDRGFAGAGRADRRKDHGRSEQDGGNGDRHQLTDFANAVAVLFHLQHSLNLAF